MLLWFIYILLLLVVISIGLIRFKHLNSALRLVLLLVGAGLVNEVAKKGFGIEIRQKLDHVYMFVELLIWAIYYFKILKRKQRLYIYSGLVIFASLMFIFHAIYDMDLWNDNYTDYVLLGVVVSVWSSLFLYELTFKPLTYSLKEDGNFWINCGTFLFYPGLVFSFGFSAYNRGANLGSLKAIATINHTLNFVLYILFAMAFLNAKNELRTVYNSKFN